MKKTVLKKLRSRAGESIAEALIAVLIIAVSAALLASMITFASRIVKESEKKMDEYYKENVKLETFEGAKSGSVKMSVNPTSNSETLTFSIPNIVVEYSENETLSNKPVIAYHVSDS